MLISTLHMSSDIAISARRQYFQFDVYSLPLYIIYTLQARTCDSCYNRVMDLQERKNREDMLSKMKPVPKVPNSNASKQFLENRSKLLAEAEESKGSTEDARGGSRRGNASNNTSQTMQTMNETHEKMLERGEKLSKLSESSNLMANQANDFAKMAKLLNEQQKNRWF